MSKITKELLKKIFPGTPASKRDRFVEPMNTILPKYDITSKKRFAAFIANVGIESDRLKALEEYASGAAYEGRAGLGNIRKGDGIRYKGRSVLQTTGRYNYWRVVVAYLRVLTGKNWYNKLADTNFDKYLKSSEYSDLLKEADKHNVNFLANPELLEVFPHAVEAAGVFVKDNDLNRYADAGQFYAYAGVINRGSPKKKALHYDLRKDLYDVAMRYIPDDFNLSKSSREVVSFATLEPQPVPESRPVGSEMVMNVPVEDVAVETRQTEVSATLSGTTLSQTVEQKNEQNVNQTVEVQKSKPYNEVGLMRTLKTDLLAVFGGNIGFEGISQLITQASGLPEWLIKILVPIFTFISIALIVAGSVWIVYRLVHYGWYKWEQYSLKKLEATINADPTKKDLAVK